MNIAFKNNRILTLGGKLFTPVPGVGPEPEPPGPQLVYLSYLNTGSTDVPIINELGSAWNLSSRVQMSTIGSSPGGSMPSTYNGKSFGTFQRGGVTGILPVQNLRKFTISAFLKWNSTRGAGEVFGYRFHTAFQFLIIYLADATSYIDFNFGLTKADNLTFYNYANSQGNNGCDIDTSLTNRNIWSYCQIYIDRDQNMAEYWINGQHIIDVHDKADLFSGAQNFDTILRYYPDSDGANVALCELAIWDGKKIGVPTEPLS